jgi:DNA-binding GntR family transcriptional regulator
VSIQDFHSKLSSRNENSVLFQALRHLRRLENIQSVLFQEEEETTAGGWGQWTDGHQHHHLAIADV